MTQSTSPQSRGSAAHEAVRHFMETARLAFPVMIARSGTVVMITADVIMTGRVDARELGYYGLAFGLANLFFVIGMGVMAATTVLVSQADGMGEPEKCGTVWRVSVVHGFVLGLLFAAFCFGGERFLLLTGQGEELARAGGRTVVQFAIGLPAVLMYMATAFFLEGIHRPRANVALMVGANLVNIGLNWLFMFSGWNLAPGIAGDMGASGAALATSLTRWVMFLGLAGYVLRMRDGERYGVRGALRYPIDFARKLRRLGLPLGLAHGLETASFTTMTLFAGLLGPLQLAVYQIGSNLFSLVYMLAIGLGTATSVRVGNAVGRGDASGVRWAGWTGAAIALGVLFGMCALFLALPGELASIYTSDPAALAVAVPALLIAGWFVIVDGGQGVMANALRGAGDIWVPSAMVVAGFWGVTVPLGYFLAFERGLAVGGLFWGLSAGALTAVVLLVARFHRISRKKIRPV